MKTYTVSRFEFVAVTVSTTLYMCKPPNIS